MKTLLIVFMVFLLFIFVSCLAQSAPASAQFATATPWPAVVATATAAAQHLNDMKAQVAASDAAFNQAVINKQQISDNYSKAQIEFANAQANLQAQQYQQTGEAIGRGNAYIETGNAQANQLFSIITQQKSIIDAQAAAYISATLDNQQCRVTVQNYSAAYTALAQQQEQHRNDATVNNIVVLFAFIAAFGLLVMLLIVVLSRRRGSVTIAHTTAEVIEPIDDDRDDDERDGSGDESIH